ncbi:hypothetical protein [Bacillus sp. JJ1566]
MTLSELEKEYKLYGHEQP